MLSDYICDCNNLGSASTTKERGRKADEKRIWDKRVSDFVDKIKELKNSFGLPTSSVWGAK